MKKEEFVKELAEYCEFEGANLTSNSILKTIEGYDSLAVMSIIAFIDENFGLKFTAQQLKSLTDFNSIMNLIGEDKFEND
jgi:acyl carrier protein